MTTPAAARLAVVYLNARANECYSAGLAGGEPAVWFKGEAYFVIGFYFARKAEGERELYYVLRATDPHGNGLYPLDRRATNGVAR